MDNRSPRSRGILDTGPTPSKMSKDSHTVIKNSQPKRPRSPQLRQQEPSQPPPQRPRITHILPRTFHVHSDDFMTFVQRTTGQDSTSTTSSSNSSSMSNSQATSEALDASRCLIYLNAQVAAMERANISNELGIVGSVEPTHQNNNHRYHQNQANISNERGFVGSVETMDQRYHHQNQVNEGPSFHHGGILMPRSTSLPVLSPDFLSPIGLTDPQANEGPSFHHGGHLDLGCFTSVVRKLEATTQETEIESSWTYDHSNGLFPSPSMADANYNQQRQYQPPMSYPQSRPFRRTRSDFEGPLPSMPSGHDMHNYLSQNEDRGIPHRVENIRPIGSVYDPYLQSVQTPMPSEEAGSFNGVDMGQPGGNNMIPGPFMGEFMTGRGGLLPPDIGRNGQAMGFDQLDSVGRSSQEPVPRPHDVSNTLYDEGLPSMPSEEAGPFNGVGMGRPGGNNMRR